MNIAQQIDALSKILTLTPQEFRHVVLSENVQVSNKTQISLFNYAIPLYNGIVITELTLKFSQADNKFGNSLFQWTANRHPVTEAIQFESQGQIFQVFGDGDLLGLSIQLNEIKPCTLFAKASGFLLPSQKTTILINNSTILLNRNGKQDEIIVL
jgi:hypothetical protein